MVLKTNIEHGTIKILKEMYIVVKKVKLKYLYGFVVIIHESCNY